MFRPAYAYLSLDEIRARAREAVAALAECRVCPRDCAVNRLEDKWAACKTGRYAAVGSHFPHFGEEDCLRGWNGSGTIFFSHCNLRCVFCFPPGTRVTTSEGLLPIEEIFERGLETPRPEVRRLDGSLRGLTREGRWAPLSKAFCHPYEGELIRLKPYCVPPITLTPEHRVFAVSKSNPALVLQLPAAELTTEHRLMVPPRQPGRRDVTIEVAEILGEERSIRQLRERDFPAEELVTLFSRQSTSAQLAQITGLHPAYARKLRGRWIRGAFGASSDVRETPDHLVFESGKVRFSMERRPGIPLRLRLDERLAWLLGLYCAEGHVTSQRDHPNSHRLVFSFSRSEAARAQQVRALLKELFGVKPTILRRRTTYTVEVGKTSLATLFRQLCGKGAREKQVPALLRTAGRSVIAAFLDGVSAGDGWDGPAHVAVTTVSKELAVGLFEVGLLLDMLPTLHRHIPAATKTIEGREVRQPPHCLVKFPKVDPATGLRRSRWKKTEHGHLLPIHRIERLSYSGPVYNLEVDDPDHSYLAPFVAVANCQNYDISQAIKPTAPESKTSTPEEIADMMLELQRRGCHNVNFVTPEHVVPQVLEAVAVAVERGLKLPIVYNTSAYDALESLAWMDGIVDIYMPDFKYWSPERSKTYMKAADSPEAARTVIREMHRQVGNLTVDADGLARRGLIVRHLVMPGFLDETKAILEWVATELGPDTYVNLMDQYYPAGTVSAERYPEINRRLTSAEFREARAMADALGLRNLDERRPHPRLGLRLAARGIF